MSRAAKCSALFRFYAELNDFLPQTRRNISIVHRFELPASVKDMLESMGVPHTEVGLILLNGMPVGFSESVRDGHQVSVYPEFRTLDVSPISQLRPALKEFRFAADIHLGRLAAYLRMLGCDTAYDPNRNDEELAKISHDQSRVLLTRDTGLLKRSMVVYGRFVRATEPKQQLSEVVRHFNLLSAVSPFTRCLRCNALLESVHKDAILDRLQPKTRQHYDEFRICPECKRVYWAGSHYERMQQFVRDIFPA